MPSNDGGADPQTLAARSRAEPGRLRRARRRRDRRSHLLRVGRDAGKAVDVDALLRPPRGQNAAARLRSDARGGHGGFREKLAAGIAMNHYRIALALTLAIVLLVVGPFLY